MIRRRRLAWGVVLLALVGGLALLLAVPRVTQWDIQIPSQAGDRITHADIRERLAPFEGARFLTLSLEAVRDALVSHPWVADARVVRVWPDRVRVSLTLQTPVARWGASALVNARGEVFRPVRPFKAAERLLRLSAPSDADAPAVLAVAAWLREQTALINWQLVALHRHPGGSLETRWWPARILWLDADRYQAQFARFLKAWPQVRADLRQGASVIDLRYSNGFSIRTHTSENGTDSRYGAQKAEQ